MTSWASALRPSGAVAVKWWTPGGSCSALARDSPCSVSMCSTVPSGSASSAAGVLPYRPTTVGGNSRSASSCWRAASAAAVARGVLASTPRAASAATTATAEAGTARSGEGL
jgi:hypothetical protein